MNLSSRTWPILPSFWMTVGSSTLADDCRFRYTEGDLLGKGTYASVYAADDKRGDLGRVALKRIEFDHNVEGCPLLLLREVGLIKNFKHPNIVPIVDFTYSPNSGVAYIAFQLLECDLRQYLNRHGPMMGSSLADAVSQVASGIAYLHTHGIIHRDLKPQNILVSFSSSGSTRSSSGLSIKIGDFGLARTYTPKLGQYTKEVMTLWYRCPELLLGGPIYGAAGDCWGLGCLIGEMGSGVAMFSGESEVAVMFKIFKTLGTPSDTEWPGVGGLAHFSKKFPKWYISEPELVENLYFMLASASRRTPRDKVRFSLNQGPSSPCSVEMKLVDIMRGLFSYIPSGRLSATEVVRRLDKAPRDS